MSDKNPTPAELATEQQKKDDVAPKTPTTYKVAEVREDGTVMLFTEDGRVFPAIAVKEGVEFRKGSQVTVKFTKDTDQVPEDAEIVGSVARD